MNERPTPETEKNVEDIGMGCQMVSADFARRLERERDKAREDLEDWENAAAHVEADHPDEVHCGCVPVLRKLLTDVRKELNEWQTLRLWGGTPEHIHDFIKGQQTRIHEAQDIEKTCEQLERERDEAREERDIARLEFEEISNDLKDARADRDIARLSAQDADKAHDRLAGELTQALKERDEAREVLREIAEASDFDNIENWARNKALEALKTK